MIAASVSAQLGYGRITASPGTKDSTSRPSWSVPRNCGAPSNPTPARCRSSACVAGLVGRWGRRTVSPTRTTSPWFAIPPGNCTSCCALLDTVSPGRFGVTAPQQHLSFVVQQGARERVVGDQAVDQAAAERG